MSTKADIAKIRRQTKQVKGVRREIEYRGRGKTQVGRVVPLPKSKTTARRKTESVDELISAVLMSAKTGEVAEAHGLRIMARKHGGRMTVTRFGYGSEKGAELSAQGVPGARLVDEPSAKSIERKQRKRDREYTKARAN
jgi:hypothetical protein